MMHCWCILNAMFLHNHNFCVGFYTVLVCMSAKMLTACWLQDGIHLMSAQRNEEYTSYAANMVSLGLESQSSEMKLLGIKQKPGLCQGWADFQCRNMSFLFFWFSWWHPPIIAPIFVSCNVLWLTEPVSNIEKASKITIPLQPISSVKRKKWVGGISFLYSRMTYSNIITIINSQLLNGNSNKLKNALKHIRGRSGCIAYYNVTINTPPWPT